NEHNDDVEDGESIRYSPPGESRSDQVRKAFSDETLEGIASERTIPIKITPEAKTILERNAQMFPRSESVEAERRNVVSENFTNDYFVQSFINLMIGHFISLKMIHQQRN
ncbi:unnamed protein product, partial [Anisakis simplex]|uniref:Ovule protein n=1 Tax=Anisakis simplex TaxID=6269 RepID=A0A0M3JIV5_ANISI